MRWVVFQRTPRGRFRLTQWLFAHDKSAAEAKAALWYAGCAGTLDVLSFVEFQMMLDDQDALHRTRVAPAETGQRRPNMKRGVSFGACVWCGAITSARGGRAPKYCAAHREWKYQRACRSGQPVSCALPQRQAVGV